MTEIRTFETGATRDLDDTKHDPEGFLSPLVIDRFNQYMHANRKQKDGTTRASDNWQKGIPDDAYMKSMWRHFLDVWMHHRGWGPQSKEPVEIALCGLLFNVMGMLDGILKRKYSQVPLEVSSKAEIIRAGELGVGVKWGPLQPSSHASLLEDRSPTPPQPSP